MDKLDAVLSPYLKYARKKSFPKNQILLYKDDPIIDLYILTNGVVKLYEENKNGSIKILHIFKPYAILPLSFFSGENRSLEWFYGALTDCDVYVIPTNKFNKLLENDYAAYRVLANWFFVEVHEILVRLSSMAKTSSYSKLIAALQFLGVHHSTRADNWRTVSFPINHQLLADLTGLSRERIAIMMKKLNKAQVIRNPKQNILEINWPKISHVPS